MVLGADHLWGAGNWMMGRLMAWLGVWAAHLWLWLIYVSQISLWELLVGAAAAGLSTLGLAVFQHCRRVKFGPSWHEIAEGWRLPHCVLSGTWSLLQSVARQLFTRRGAHSSLAAVRFEVGGDDPAGAGRRSLAVLYTTMTPNSVVIGIVREQGLMLYHQIIPGDVLQITRHLGAKQ